MAVLFLFWAILPVTKPAPNFVSTKILDRNGGLLYEIANEREGLNTYASLKEIPLQFQQAVIAAEDARFYSHHGVDLLALIRATKDKLLGHSNGGASTIEQQLIKNLYFPGAHRTVIQKAREITAATYWSGTHSKDETLEKYLNIIFLGNRSFGISAATQTYFHKNIADLTLAESSLLAGIIPAPTKYEPYRHLSMAQARQQYVLDRLVKNNLITVEQKSEADAEQIQIFTPEQDISAPHFVFQVLEDLEEKIPNISSGGFTITTTLDPELQSVSEKAIFRRLADLTAQNVNNAALVAIQPQTGDILAYVGSKNYFNEKIDGSVDMVQAERQPGSALKPFLYLDAFMNGLTPATVVADLPVRFENADGKAYYPKNYNYKYYGPVTIRDALGSSLNITAVKVLNQLGLPSFFSMLNRFGISFEKPPDYYGLGAVLGGGEVKFLDLARAYSGLALYGQSSDLRNVLEIKDAGGEIIFKSESVKHQPLFEDDEKGRSAAALVADILSDKTARARSFGEANLLSLEKKIAVKTGTTRDFRDNWAFGYTPDFTLGVWVGNADNSPMLGVSGISGAVPIWHDIMRFRFDKEKEIVWPPVELTKRSICLPSGLLATDICPKQRLESFMPGTEPKEQDSWYEKISIDSKSGLIANSQCTQNQIEKTFLILPPQYQGWIDAKQTEQAPITDCQGRITGTQNRPTILSPIDGDIFELSNLIDSQAQSVPFIAGGQLSKYQWILDGRSIETSDNITLWQPSPGGHSLRLEGASQEIKFTIK